MGRDEPLADATTTVVETLVALAAEQRTRLARAWPSVRIGDGAGLRRARIASRRLREMLAVAETVAPGRHIERARRDVRRITRALGPMREIEVTIDRLGAATARHGWTAARLAPVQRRLLKEQKRRRSALTEWLAETDEKALDRRLAVVTRRLRGLDPASVEQALVVRMLRRAREARSAITRCGTLYAPDRLHEVRIAIKKLRYALELGEAAGHAELAPIVSSLARIQKRFGQLHDEQMLQGEVMAAASGPGVAARMAGEVVGDALERDCRALHAGIVADLHKLEACLGEVRRLAVAATAAAVATRPGQLSMDAAKREPTRLRQPRRPRTAG